MYLFNFNLPLVLCNTNDFFGNTFSKKRNGRLKEENIFLFFSAAAMLSAFQDCSPLDVLAGGCITDPDSAFKAEWGDCLFGTLNHEEQIWSDRIVKAWTNFATFG